MSTLVILLLAALWAAILLPAALRTRREHHPVASADGFARAMTTLAGRQGSSRRSWVPRRAAAPLRRLSRRLPRPARLRQLLAPPATPAARRRRTILTGLVAALAVAVVLGTVAGGLAWVPAGVIGAALAGYLGLVLVFVGRARAGAQRARPAPSARASAARAAAVRAAVARPAAGEAPPAPAPAPADRPLDQVAAAGLAPAGEHPAPAAGEPSAVGAPRAPDPVRAAGPYPEAGGRPAAGAGGGVAAGGVWASESVPRTTRVSGNAGLVAIRTLPRAGG